MAWLASQITPAYVSRYFAPVLGAILLLAALGLRAGRDRRDRRDRVSSVVFLVHTPPVRARYKSDMRDVAGEMTPLMHKGDLVIVAQPEQIPLAWYYLPPDCDYANTIGPVSDPSYMNWVTRSSRLQRRQPAGDARTAAR